MQYQQNRHLYSFRDRKRTRHPLLCCCASIHIRFERMEDEIEIELRKPDELKFFGSQQIAPLDVEVYNLL